MSRRRNPGDPRRAAARGRPQTGAGNDAAGTQTGAGAAPGGNGSPTGDDAPRSHGGRRATLLQVGIVIGAFIVATLLAELFGAANLGVAIGVGQIGFAVALVVVLLRGS